MDGVPVKRLFRQSGDDISTFCAINDSKSLLSQTVAACLLSLLEGNFNSITPRDIPEQKITHANPGRRKWQVVATLQGMGILISFLSLFF